MPAKRLSRLVRNPDFRQKAACIKLSEDAGAALGHHGAEVRIGDLAFLTVESFLDPTTLYLADAATGEAKPIKSLPARFDASKDVIEQFEATSTDRTKVPYFVVRPKALKLDGTAPTLLYAWLWIALLTFRELTLAVILSTADNVTFPIVVWSLWLGGGLGQASALAVVMLLLMTPVIVLYWLLARRLGLKAA